MLLLVSGATTYPRDASVGHLIVPGQWSRSALLEVTAGACPWAIDNGAFTGFNEGAYVRVLEKFSSSPGCLFAAAPDFVGDFASTLDRWPFWSRLLRGVGFRPAFVAQDGLQQERMPWAEMSAVFIGGTTTFKESPTALALIAYAKARGIWVHVGRVNGRRRYALMLKAGADSIDGTGFSIAPDTNIALAPEWQERTRSQGTLL